MNPISMIDTPPDCGSPCAMCESYAHLLAKAREEIARLAAKLNTEETLYDGACDVAGGDPVQVIYALRAEVARLREDEKRLEKLLDLDVRISHGGGWWHFNCRSDVDAFGDAAKGGMK